MLNIVIIDGLSLSADDLSWDRFSALGNVRVYDYSSLGSNIDVLLDADVIVANKFILSAEIISKLPKLKCISVTATGYNNIDIQAAQKNNIVVCNAPGYSTVSTAQHTIALMLELTNHCGQNHRNVVDGKWTASRSWCDNRVPNIDVFGKTMGIIGVGAIGKQVANVARAMGMDTIGYSRSQSSGSRDGVDMVDLDTLYNTSDVITLHCPLNAESQYIINSTSISKMKKSAFIINASRGGLVNEDDLSQALIKGDIAGAAVDVLSSEPPSMDNPMIHAPNCIITPHLAWASRDCRDRLMQITFDNIKGFINVNAQNVVSR